MICNKFIGDFLIFLSFYYFRSLLCFRSLFFPFSFTYLHRALDRYDYSVTASSGSGDPPPNGGHAQPIQPPSTNTNFNHIISEKLDVVNSLLEIAGWTYDQLLLSWLPSTISVSMLHKFIGCTNSWSLRDKIHNYFHAHTNASEAVVYWSSLNLPWRSICFWFSFYNTKHCSLSCCYGWFDFCERTYRHHYWRSTRDLWFFYCFHHE